MNWLTLLLPVSYFFTLHTNISNIKAKKVNTLIKNSLLRLDLLCMQPIIWARIYESVAFGALKNTVSRDGLAPMHITPKILSNVLLNQKKNTTVNNSVTSKKLRLLKNVDTLSLGKSIFSAVPGSPPNKPKMLNRSIKKIDQNTVTG